MGTYSRIKGGVIMHLLVSGQGIIEVKQTSTIKKLFCKHKETTTGISCSSIGLMRISGADTYRVCSECGKVLAEQHTQY